MNIFLDEHQQFLEQLINKKVSFILVGGYAVNYHGYNRTTGDMDILLQPSNENYAKLFDILEEMDFNKEDMVKLRQIDFTKTFFFHIWEPPYRIDFLNKISGVEFTEADSKKILAKIEGIEVPFLHINHLILSKIATGRPQDKADVEILNKLKGL